MKRVEQFYDRHAPAYEAKFDVPLVRRIKRMEEDGVRAFLNDHLPVSGRLLELGCGTGLFTLPAARRGYEITAVDISANMIAELRRKLDAAALGGVTLLKADVEDLGGLDPFDGVYGIGLLEYLGAPARAVRRAAELLRPGGVAVFTAPTLSLSGGGYYAASLLRKRLQMKLFTRHALSRLFTSAGLELVEVRPVGFHLPLISPLTRIAAGRKPAKTARQGEWTH